MRNSRFKITYTTDVPGEIGVEEVHAEQVGHIHDGTVSWLNFHDGAGEVLRVRSESVERVERVG